MSGETPPDDPSIEKIDNAISNVVQTLAKNEDKKKTLWSAGGGDDGYSSYTSTPKSLDHKSGCGDAKTSQLPDGALIIALPQDPAVEERPTWNQKADFLLSIIGFAVDLANVWRFPYLCYRNGGGVFLIPYLLMLVFGAMPLFYMELVLGQYHRQGPISVWKFCPLFKGVGYCCVLVSWYVSFYYNVIIAWTLYYMFISFSVELPWIRCNNPWNTDRCWESRNSSGYIIALNSSELRANRTSPALEFFDRAVLEIHESSGMDDLGTPKWQLVVCVLVAFIILYIALFRGVKSLGKVVWFTAIAPYVILTMLLIRGLLLPGAAQGVQYYLRPDLHKLLDTQVWVDAAVQVFYSVGVGFGVHLTYASYNNFNNNCYRDCLLTVAVNSFTSFYSGFVIFAYLGYMANKESLPISEVATEGHGLVFQVYPEAIATLPGGPFWAVLFFTMLLTLGLDSAMGGLESVITGILDECSGFFTKWKINREVFTAVVLATSFCVSLVNVTRGGGYMMYWFDTYSAGISLLCAALFEAIGVAWIYGLDRFCDNIQEMMGFTPGLFWRLCWKIISPFFLVAVIVSAIISNTTLQYQDYVYPQWAVGLGWGFALSSVAMVPIVAIYKLCKAPGDTCAKKLAYTITPEEERDVSENGDVKRFHWKHWVYV
ncbi:hypothetical protein JTE90_010377 [Oedothorax gibbosus]|uniref:Transporter n=1 Tax=Oedothorax gibbosus TaxID=931172 RepID=A0AAV6W4Z5_9ARAC|nr:hypothetical protein JTE90_010377 [Oedothorax gibbosus]